MTVKSEFQKFSEMTKRLLSVSKKEFNRREAEWKKQPGEQRKTKKTSDAAFPAILARLQASRAFSSRAAQSACRPAHHR